MSQHAQDTFRVSESSATHSCNGVTKSGFESDPVGDPSSRFLLCFYLVTPLRQLRDLGSDCRASKIDAGLSSVRNARLIPRVLGNATGSLIGLRRGQALSLLWSDFDFEERTPSVRRSLKRENNQLRFGQPITSGNSVSRTV